MPDEEFEVVKAVRLAVPLLISLAGPSGSGKTFSGLLMAGGIAGNDGQVGMVDAETGRGSLYADDPDIMKAIPKGYLRTPISLPYTPARYIKAIKAQEAAGTTVCLIDSTSHEWEGDGGCTDIAENNKLRGMPNWAMAKREHKRFMAYSLSSRMHLIFCLRAREKVRIIKDGNGKEQIVPIGIQPIAEKNFVFEMLISLMFDDLTHQYSGIKVPKMLTSMFPGGKLITREHGEMIRRWNEGGRAIDPMESVQKRARAAAELGVEEYQALFLSLSKAEQKALASTTHAANKEIAEAADKAAAELAKQEQEAV